MKIFFKHLGYTVLVAGIAYVIGSLFPFSIFSFVIDADKSTSKGESVYYLICLFQVILMIITALLAVFGDHIRQRLRHPSLNPQLRSNDIKEELIDPTAKQKESKRYYNILDIHNDGKQNASDCELIIEKITYTKGNETVELLLDEVEVEFIGGKNYISVNGKKSVQIFELIAAQEQGQTKNENAKLKPQMMICGQMIQSQYAIGNITLTLRLNTISTESMLIKVRVNWDGVWENRSVDMVKHLTTEII